MPGFSSLMMYLIECVMVSDDYKATECIGNVC